MKKTITRLLMFAAIGAAVLYGMYSRNRGPKVKEIDPNIATKGKVLLVDVMEAPILEDEDYIEPKKFNCVTLRDKFLRTPISELGQIPTEKIKEAQCDKVLAKFEQSIAIKKLIKCLNEDQRTVDCAKHLLYFRAFSIENLIKSEPDMLKENDNVKLHKIIWDLASTFEYKVNHMEGLIDRIDLLLAKHPYLYALHKAKLIYVVIKDVNYPQKVIDDRMYKTWEIMTELRPDTRDNWELRFMNILKHKEFFEPKDMKNWADTFLLDYPDYYMSYYYYAYYYWEIEQDKAEAISWLQTGIDKTGDPHAKLKQALNKVKASKINDKIFEFEFNFEIIHD